MNLIKPFDYQTQLLGKVLDLRADKAQIISANIANAETPGFSPSRFRFEEDLAQAIQQNNHNRLTVTNPGHISLTPISFEAVNGKITVEKDLRGIGDKNGVNVNEEMISLSENELLYETTAQLLKKRLGLLKYVISGGQ